MRTLRYVGAPAIALSFLLTCNAIAQHRSVLVGHAATSHASAHKPDPISGEWDVTFHVRDQSTAATFTLKLDGTKVTGKVFSEHTGPGTIRGSFTDGKLNLTADFEKHESIKISGALKDDKLAGEFQTEGFTEKWEGTRKTAK
jgi:hypothetical protein